MSDRLDFDFGHAWNESHRTKASLIVMLYVITSNLGHVGQIRFRLWSRMECTHRTKASLYAMRYQIISNWVTSDNAELSLTLWSRMKCDTLHWGFLFSVYKRMILRVSSPSCLWLFLSLPLFLKFSWHFPALSLGSCPESLAAHGQARLFGVAGSNPPGSVSTSLSDSSESMLEVLSPLRSSSFLFFQKQTSIAICG